MLARSAPREPPDAPAERRDMAPSMSVTNVARSVSLRVIADAAASARLGLARPSRRRSEPHFSPRFAATHPAM